MLPFLAKLPWKEQICVAFMSDSDRNPVLGMDMQTRITAIAAYLGEKKDIDIVKAVASGIKIKGNKYYEAAKEYSCCQPKPMHIALSAIDAQIVDISQQIKGLEITISADASDKTFERFMSFLEKIAKYVDSRTALLESIGGEYEIAFYKMFKHSEVKQESILEKFRKV